METTETTEKELIEKLEKIAEENKYDNPLKTYVCDHITYLYNSDESVIGFLNSVANNGCISGMVCGLVTYADTHAFFDKYYDDIEELRIEMEEETGQPLDLQGNLKNALAWFGFEQTAYNLANELELEI